MIGVALRILRRIGLIEGVHVGDSDRLNAAFTVGGGLDFKRALVRQMNSENVLGPAREDKKREGGGIGSAFPGKTFMRTEAKAIGEENLTGDRRNHGCFRNAWSNVKRLAAYSSIVDGDAKRQSPERR